MKRVIRDIREFSTDGCTMSPDFDFRICCVKHDLDYWRGKVSRAEADRRLRECIHAHGYRVLPWIYWAGVRLFGCGRYRKHHKRGKS